MTQRDKKKKIQLNNIYEHFHQVDKVLKYQPCFFVLFFFQIENTVDAEGGMQGVERH